MTHLLAYLGVFAAVITESTIIIGTFSPGLTTVIAASLLASTGRLDIVPVFIAAWSGMFLGDFGGYLLGRFGLDRVAVAKRWFDKARPSVERFLQQHRRLIIFYQFVGFVRSPVPIFLGSIRHPIKQWVSLLLRATTLFMTCLVGGSYLLGRLVGHQTAVRIAVLSQIVVAVLFVGLVIQTLLKYRRRRH